MHWRGNDDPTVNFRILSGRKTLSQFSKPMNVSRISVCQWCFRSEKQHKSATNGTPDSPWLRPNLRVRVVDPQYSKGRYFKVKVTVEDVISLDECICRTDEGKVLEGIGLCCCFTRHIVAPFVFVVAGEA